MSEKQAEESKPFLQIISELLHTPTVHTINNFLSPQNETHDVQTKDKDIQMSDLNIIQDDDWLLV